MPRRDVEEWFWTVGSDMHRLSRELGGSRPKIASGRCWEPHVDVVEQDRAFLLKAEIAGVEADDIGLAYIPDRHSLLIRGVRAEDDGDGARTGIHQLEICYGEFQREVKLPDAPINPNGIRARYRNGILSVLIPKAEKLVVTKTVTVRRI
jgi:HSP20 family protein